MQQPLDLGMILYLSLVNSRNLFLGLKNAFQWNYAELDTPVKQITLGELFPGQKIDLSEHSKSVSRKWYHNIV